MIRPLAILLLVAIGAGQSGIGTAMCPSVCKCTDLGNIRCLNCLRTYFRDYSSVSASCPCISGFVELYVPGEYCCSQNCTSCSAKGNCLSCAKNWTLQTSGSGVRVCICSENFYYDRNECRCMSHIKPGRYYWVGPEEACL